MILTESYAEVFPAELLERYDFAETRNAAAIMKITQPEAFDDLIDVLRKFSLTVDLIVRPGGNKSKIAEQLDSAFRAKGFREARFEQDVTTRLLVSSWGQEKGEKLETKNSFGGHKIDNVRGRAVVDIEWNPQDGNLDRDFNNYVSLYDAGLIDVGIIVARHGGDFRYFVRKLVANVKDVAVPDASDAWQHRVSRTPDDPYGTSTTANFEKLFGRLSRGDGRGCPVLAVGIGERAFDAPESLVEEVLRLAQKE